MKNLKGVKERRWGRSANRKQCCLLLLRPIGDVGVERDGKQRMVVHQTAACSDDRFAVAHDVPGKSGSRCPVVRISREALSYSENILSCLHVCSGQLNMS